MTAPVAPTTPAAAPAPVPVAAPAPVQRTLNAAISAVAKQTSVAPDPVAPPPPVVTIVRDTPKPDAPASADAPVGSAPVAEAPPADASPAPVAEALGELTVDNGDVTLTAERNADGTYKSKIDPTAKFDFKLRDPSSGETRSYSKTIPEIIRLAKDGVTLQRLVPEVQHYRTNFPQLQEQAKRVTTDLEEQRALNLELLTAPDEIVIARREQYKAEMSPEKRLERLEAERAQEQARAKQSEESQRIAVQAQTFVQTRLAPVITSAETALGNDDVAKEMVQGYLARVTQPLLVDGKVPADRWPLLEKHLTTPDGPFQKWVKTRAAARQSESAAARKAREDAEAEQRRAQAAVNAAGAPLAPVGRAGADTPAQLPKPKTTKEAMQRLINRPLPQSVAASG